MTALRYLLDVSRPHLRRIAVTLEVDRDLLTAGTSRQATLFLPSWTPGSYMIRDYARHLGPLDVRDASTGASIAYRKISKNRFAIDLPDSGVRFRINYEVYAHDLTVRTADVTSEHAYWNHACVLLWPLGQPGRRAVIEVRAPAGWKVATSLPRCEEGKCDHAFVADNLDQAMDAPVLAGQFQRMDWQVRGVPHSVVLDGLGEVRPPASLLDDLTAIISHVGDVFGGELPYPQYIFLCLFATDGHGGLEHSASTTLLSARSAMRPGKPYQSFLGLAAHELFHAWNIKRMRPVELWSYDYEVENYTSLLWFVEGFTAYYDDLICRRAGVIHVDDYLGIVGKNMTSVVTGAGRFRQTLGEASFDAWIRLYRPDENTRNSTQNYYVNGSVAALCLDLTIRAATAGQQSLDDALRELYRRTFGAGRGYERRDIEDCLAIACGRSMKVELESLIDRALDPDFDSLFTPFGIAVKRTERDKPYLGVSFEQGTTTISTVSEDGPAMAAGLAPGDEVLALEGVRVQAGSWGEVFGLLAKAGRSIRLLIASRGLVVERVVTPAENPVGTLQLEVMTASTPEATRLREQWLCIAKPVAQTAAQVAEAAGQAGRAAPTTVPAKGGKAS